MNHVIFTVTTAFICLGSATAFAAPPDNAFCEFQTFDPEYAPYEPARSTAIPCHLVADENGSYVASFPLQPRLANYGNGGIRKLHFDLHPPSPVPAAALRVEDQDGYYEPLGTLTQSEFDPSCWVGETAYICTNATTDRQPPIRQFPTPPLTGKVFGKVTCRMQSCHWKNYGAPTKTTGPSALGTGRFIDVMVSRATSVHHGSQDYPATPPIDLVWSEPTSEQYFCSIENPHVRFAGGEWEPVIIDVSTVYYATAISYAHACHEIGYDGAYETLLSLGYQENNP